MNARRQDVCDVYEDDPTVPWWDRPEEPSPSRSTPHLLFYPVVLLLVLVLVLVCDAGVLVFG